MKSVSMVVLSSLVLAPSICAAQAADDVLGLKDAVVSSPWEGFYLGAGLGSLFNDNSVTFEAGALPEGARSPSLDEDDGNGSAFLGGFYLGYNWIETERGFMIGFETDLGFTADIDYLATARGRVGFTRGNALFYFSGGLAVADLGDQNNVRVFSPIGMTPADDVLVPGFDRGSEGQAGYVVGAGADFQIGRGWSLGLEGLYYDFGESTYSGDINTLPGDDDLPVPVTVEENNDFWSVRGRLTYHFQRRDEPVAEIVAPAK